jgi:DNA-binding NarL/FixJ family response regulator
VVLAEDAVLLREGLVGLLARFGHEVVAAVGDADALRAAVAEHAPDLVLTDVRMPPGFQDEGLRAALALRADRPGLPVLVLSQYVQRSYAAELLDTGDGTGVGYLLKDRVGQVEQFVEAAERVASNGTVVCAAAATPWSASPRASARYSPWSPRAGRTARSPGTWW